MTRILIALALVLAMLILLPALAGAQAAPCYGLAMLKASFRVVFPEGRQVTMEGSAVKAYLDGYNSFGDPTDYSGDTLFLTIMPNGTALVVPLDAGRGCRRLVVGPRLHKMIMAKVARGAI